MALGTAVHGALIAGMDVGPVLVDITTHTLGISALGDLHCFAPIIEWNPPLPRASKIEFDLVVMETRRLDGVRCVASSPWTQEPRYPGTDDRLAR